MNESEAVVFQMYLLTATPSTLPAVKMDTLSFKKYRKQGALVDGDVDSLTQLSKSKRPQVGNTTLTHKGLVKSDREFLEFFVNDQPLSELLNKFYGTRGSILDNWVGVLGSFANNKGEVLKVKQLIGKTISDREIRQVYPLTGATVNFNGT